MAIAQSQPSLSDRLAGLRAPESAPQSTQPFSDKIMRDDPIKEIGYDVINKFPFTSQAKIRLSALKFKGVHPTGGINNKDNVEGVYKTRGQDVFNAANKVFNTNVSEWVADKLANFDAPDITMKRGNDNQNEIMSHEMLHHLFDSSAMEDPKTGQAWLKAWDTVRRNDTDIGPLLSGIDDHLIQSGYETDNAYSVATERFSYLGEKALKYGIDVIPKELRPYYYGIIEGAPKPTAEQLGEGLDPSQGFSIDIGDRPDTESRSDAPQGPIDRTTLADRIYGLMTGASVSRIENPNAGKFPKKEVIAAPDKQVILGTLFGEVSNRAPEKQMLEAQTILNTARNRAKRRGTTLVEELKRPQQYQAYQGNEYKRFISGDVKPTDKQKVDAITKILSDLEAGTLEDNIDGAEYYIHKPDGSILATKEYLYGKKKSTP